MISECLFNKAAYIYAPIHSGVGMTGGIADEVAVYTKGDPPAADSRPCLFVPQMVGSTESRLGLMPTGDYQILFQPGVTIKENYVLVIDTIRYRVKGCASFDTHTEATISKLPGKTK